MGLCNSDGSNSSPLRCLTCRQFKCKCIPYPEMQKDIKARFDTSKVDKFLMDQEEFILSQKKYIQEFAEQSAFTDADRKEFKEIEALKNVDWNQELKILRLRGWRNVGWE